MAEEVGGQMSEPEAQGVEGEDVPVEVDEEADRARAMDGQSVARTSAQVQKWASTEAADNMGGKAENLGA